jgi:hypothetical protein
MFDDDDLHVVVAHVRMVVSDCCDLRAVERLRFFAHQMSATLDGHGDARRSTEKSLRDNDSSLIRRPDGSLV